MGSARALAQRMIRAICSVVLLVFPLLSASANAESSGALSFVDAKEISHPAANVGETVRGRFKIRNPLTVPVEIRVASRSCACSTATLASECLRPDESTDLDYAFFFTEPGNWGVDILLSISGKQSADGDLQLPLRVKCAFINGLKTEPNKIVVRRAVIGQEYEKEIFIRRGYDDQASVAQTTATISPVDIGSVTKWELSRRSAERIFLEEIHATLRFRIPQDREDAPKINGFVQLCYPGEKERTREQRIPVTLLKAPRYCLSPPSLYFDVAEGRTSGTIQMVAEEEDSSDSPRVVSARIERFPRYFSIKGRSVPSNAVDVSLSTRPLGTQWLDDSLLVTADDGSSSTLPIVVKNTFQ